jgi:hypothetical protein
MPISSAQGRELFDQISSFEMSCSNQSAPKYERFEQFLSSELKLNLCTPNGNAQTMKSIMEGNSYSTNHLFA